jgi:hypothetical protein
VEQLKSNSNTQTQSLSRMEMVIMDKIIENQQINT